MEHDDVPPLCARLLAELSRRNEPTALADLPEHLRQKAVLSGCERRGLAVGVVWYEGAPGSSGVLPGGAPYVAVGTSAGWYPSAGLTHRPAPTHFAITPKGKAWLEEEQLRTDPHVEKLRAAGEAVGEYERRYQEGLERVSRAVQSVPPFAETMKEAYLEALAEHGQRTAADPPKALPAPTGDADAHGKSAKRNKRRGRKPDTDPKEDKRIAEAYESGGYARNADCDRALGLPEGTTYAARERHRKRMSRRK